MLWILLGVSDCDLWIPIPPPFPILIVIVETGVQINDFYHFPLIPVFGGPLWLIRRRLLHLFLFILQFLVFNIDYFLQAFWIVLFLIVEWIAFDVSQVVDVVVDLTLALFSTMLHFLLTDSLHFGFGSHGSINMRFRLSTHLTAHSLVL